MFELRRQGATARLVFAGAGKRNAVTIEGWKELERLVHRANDSDARVIVFESELEGSFCAGADLAELWSLSEDVRMRRCFRGAVGGAMDRIRASNKPTVALIAGGCFGIGVSLATACDIRVATPKASFAITPARFGISYPQADLSRLVCLIGRGQTARLVYGCEEIDAAEAHRIGLVEILDITGRDGETILGNIGSNSPTSLRALKASLLNRFGTSESFDACFGSPDFAERIGRLRTASRNAPAAT